MYCTVPVCLSQQQRIKSSTKSINDNMKRITIISCTIYAFINSIFIITLNQLPFTIAFSLHVRRNQVQVVKQNRFHIFTKTIKCNADDDTDDDADAETAPFTVLNAHRFGTLFQRRDDGDVSFELNPYSTQSTRRMFMKMLTFTSFITTVSNAAYALGDDDPSTATTTHKIEREDATILLEGEVTLQPGTSIPEDVSSSALYITARPNNTVDVPRAILDGSNGKAPPVLVARFPNVVQYPFSFDFKSSDVTVEGNTSSADESFWWEGKDLIVSARWDTDGIASTRNPSDLVGRGLYIKNGAKTSIQLQGRGAAGKYFTKSNNK
jgi:hypothetical protein